MAEPAAGKAVVLATRNPGKLRELAAMLTPLGFAVRALSEFRAPQVIESAPTFVENALLKARSAASACAAAAIADDSGLEVDALHGAPGVVSARYAGEGASDEDNVNALLAALAGVSEEHRQARFRCVTVYLAHAGDPAPIVCEGTWEGRIAAAPRGTNGFGYDPVFVDGVSGRTAAELCTREKNVLSHRAQAVSALVRRLRATPP